MIHRVFVLVLLFICSACGGPHPPTVSSPALLACINKISPDACPANTALACEEKALTDCSGKAEGSIVKKEAGVQFGCLIDNGVLYACKIIVDKPCSAGMTVKISKSELSCVSAGSK